MKRKIMSVFLVASMMFTMVSPSFAAAPGPTTQAQRDALKQIVYNELKNGAALIPQDFIADLIKNFLLDNFDPAALGGLAGPVISGLVEGLLTQQGITLPDSIDIDGIIGQVLGNDIVNQILTSDFVADVLEKTIEKVLDHVVANIVDIEDQVAWNMAETITEILWSQAATYKVGAADLLALGNLNIPSALNSLFNALSRDIWDGNNWVTAPITLNLVIWNLNTGISPLKAAIWKEAALNYQELFNIDPTSLISTDVILNALWESFLEVGEDYLRAFAIGKLNDTFGTSIALDADNETIKAALIEMLIFNARAAVIAQVNDCLDLDIAPDATDEEILCAIVNMFKDKARAAFIDELNRIITDIQIRRDAKRDEIKAEIQAAIARIKAINFCNDIAPIVIHKLECLQFIARLFCLHEINDCIDEILACINTRCEAPRLLDYSYISYIRVAGNAAVTKIDVEVTSVYTDGTSESYTGVYSGAYTVGQIIDVTTSGSDVHIVHVKMKKAPANYIAGADYWLD